MKRGGEPSGCGGALFLSLACMVVVIGLLWGIGVGRSGWSLVWPWTRTPAPVTTTPAAPKQAPPKSATPPVATQPPGTPPAQTPQVPATPVTYFTIQTGAFRSQANAQALADELRGKDYPVQVSQDDLFRVLVGISGRPTAGDKTAAALQAAGYEVLAKELTLSAGATQAQRAATSTISTLLAALDGWLLDKDAAKVKAVTAPSLPADMPAAVSDALKGATSAIQTLAAKPGATAERAAAASLLKASETVRAWLPR